MRSRSEGLAQRPSSVPPIRACRFQYAFNVADFTLPLLAVPAGRMLESKSRMDTVLERLTWRLIAVLTGEGGRGSCPSLVDMAHRPSSLLIPRCAVVAAGDAIVTAVKIALPSTSMRQISSSLQRALAQLAQLQSAVLCCYAALALHAHGEPGAEERVAQAGSVLWDRLEEHGAVTTELQEAQTHLQPATREWGLWFLRPRHWAAAQAKRGPQSLLRPGKGPIHQWPLGWRRGQAQRRKRDKGRVGHSASEPLLSDDGASDSEGSGAAGDHVGPEGGTGLRQGGRLAPVHSVGSGLDIEAALHPEEVEMRSGGEGEGEGDGAREKGGVGAWKRWVKAVFGFLEDVPRPSGDREHVSNEDDREARDRLGKVWKRHTFPSTSVKALIDSIHTLHHLATASGFSLGATKSARVGPSRPKDFRMATEGAGDGAAPRGWHA